MTVLSMELLAETVGDHLPDPEVDAIQALFYTILNDVHPDKGTRETTGVIMVDAKSAKSQKQEIIDKITKLKEDWPALATVNVISDQVKPSKGKDLFK